MKFGILYNTDYYPQAHGSASQYYAQILEQVQLEEELGFHAVCSANIITPAIRSDRRR